MNPHHGRDLARPQVPVTPVILRGGVWTARRIRNNCFRQHCHALATVFRRRDLAGLKAACARIFPVLETRSHVLHHLHRKELDVVSIVARLGAYSNKWLRHPEDWHPDPQADARTQWASLLRHLLARYPVPAFLDAVWQIKGELAHFERDCWCALAQGISLRDVRGFPASISGRVLHLALTSGHGRSLAEALWLAQSRHLGASSALQAAVLSSRVLVQFSDHALWVRLVAKFAAGEEAASSQFGLVADALAAIRSHRDAAQVELLLKLPLPELIRHCIKVVTTLLRERGHLLTDEQVREAAAMAELNKLSSSRWRPLLGREPFASKCGQAHGHASWQVQELCSIDDLKREGSAMRHCVARYAWRCWKGSSAIFSLRHHRTDDAGQAQVTSFATIEVQPRTLRVVQIRAHCNRPVNTYHMNIIHEWSMAKGLVC